MSKIFVQPPEDTSFDSFLSYALDKGFNLEIASFAYSHVLDGNWREILENYQQKLGGFSGTISVHGVFQDLLLHSRDAKIRELARQRFLQNLEIAVALKAEYVVFHGNFNPLISQESYRRNWVTQNAAFWSEALSKYEITILLENTWEPTPEMFRRLLDEVRSPRLQVCYDTGHVNIFSKVPMEEWFAVLGQDISYIHVNDNQGVVDDELVPGRGSVNWWEFSECVEKHAPSPAVVMEVGTLEKTERALAYLKEEQLYPFQAVM